MARYKHEAKITVKMGRFPLDMLRYDACYPDTQQDSAAMEHYPGNPQDVKNIKVCKITDSKTDGFTSARWKSFGCEIEVLPVRRL